MSAQDERLCKLTDAEIDALPLYLALRLKNDITREWLGGRQVDYDWYRAQLSQQNTEEK